MLVIPSVAEGSRNMSLDIQLFRAINNFAGSNPIRDGIGIFLASDLIIFQAFLVFLILLWMLRCGKMEQARAFLILTAASVIISFGLSLAFGVVRFRNRPFAVVPRAHQLIEAPLVAKSFPSGHATIAFALAFATALTIPAWTIPMLAIALLVGLGRVYVGVHYPLDVAGGALLALVVTWLVKKQLHLK